MRACIKNIISPDVPDLERWIPTTPNFFGFALEVSVGPADREGAEIFQMTVCTPSWFERKMSGNEVVSGEHTLFMQRYSYRALVNFLERRCNRCEAPTWKEIASELRLLGQWEFDGYKP